MSRSELVGAAALVGALVLTSLLGTLGPLDDAVYLAIQYHRTCAVESGARWIDPAVRLLFGALIAAAIMSGARDRGLLLRIGVLVASGAILGEILKTVIERVRPSDSPGDLDGNSFPSGHVMNTAMFAVAACLLARRAGRSRPVRIAVYGIAVLAVVAQAGFRLVNGSHWASDVPVSVLLGVGWMLAGTALARLPRAVPVLLGIGAVAAFAISYANPALRWPLPSPAVETRRSVGSLEAGGPEAGLEQGWSHGWKEPIGPVSWALEREVSGIVVVRRPGARVLRVAVRPPGEGEAGEGCLRLRIRINDFDVPPITLQEGWRELRIRTPPGALRVGRNRITFRVVEDIRTGEGRRAPGLLAVRYVRAFADLPRTNFWSLHAGMR